jgi:C1A family cysteine protease
MPNNDDYRVDGFIPEPDSDKHWSFEDKLRDKMVAQETGDVDLREFSSPRHDQKRTSSCVANAVVKALEIKRILEHGKEAHVDLSIMQVYYLARELMLPPKTHVDGGTYVSHACDVLRRFGVAPSSDWPWDPDKICESPPWMAMRKAYLHKIVSFFKIRSTKAARVEAVIEALRAHNPVVFGTTVGWNWNNYRKGQVLECPSSVRGRHATCLLGYKDGKFIGENSWGDGWGDNGFYLMDPQVIACNQASDFWVIQAGWEPCAVE